MPEQATATATDKAESKPAAETLEAGLRRLALTGINDALAEVEGAQDDDSAIHALRKQCKGMRALLHMFARGLPGRGRRMRRQFRDLARSLSARRDARVVLDVHEDLLARYGTLLDPAVGAEVRQRLIAARQAAAQSASNGSGAEGLDRYRIRTALLELRDEVAELELSTGRRGLMLDAVERTYRQGRIAATQCAETPDPAHLHTWRKCVKALSYQLEFCAALGSGNDEWLETVRTLGDLLGQAQDCAIYRDAIESAASDRNPLGVELLAALAERRRRRLRRQAIMLGRQFYSEKPKRFRAQLKAASSKG